LTEDMFIGWLLHEPQLLVWLSTMYRMQVAEMGKYMFKYSCSSCAAWPWRWRIFSPNGTVFSSQKIWILGNTAKRTSNPVLHAYLQTRLQYFAAHDWCLLQSSVLQVFSIYGILDPHSGKG